MRVITASPPGRSSRSSSRNSATTRSSADAGLPPRPGIRTTVGSRSRSGLVLSPSSSKPPQSRSAAAPSPPIRRRPSKDGSAGCARGPGQASPDGPSGPFDKFERADDFIEAIKGLAPIVEDVHVRRLFADGDDVCLIFDMVTAGAGSQPTAEWYSVRDGRIASLRVIFDARPFAAMFEGRG